MSSQPERRIFALTVQHPALGAAIVPVGVLGFSGGSSVVSWMPGADTAQWAARVAVLEAADDKDATIAEWAERANGIAWDLQEVSSDSTGDLRTAVEGVLDMLMATPG